MIHLDKMRPVLCMAGLALFVALASTAISALLTATTPSVTQGSEIEAASFQIGDHVTATGDLVQLPDGRTFICVAAGGLLTVGSPNLPTCSPVAVPVADLEVDLVPGAQPAEGGWFARGVRVRGLWDRHGIRVTAVTPAAVVDKRPPNPCDHEGDGTGLGTEIEEQALRLLGSRLAAQPGRFVGLWRASSKDGLGRIVVGALGDIEAARADVRVVYPFSVCVIPAKYSAVDLRNAAGRLAASSNWIARIDPSVDRVRVSVGVLDEATRQLLEPHGDVIVVDELLEHD